MNPLQKVIMSSLFCTMIGILVRLLMRMGEQSPICSAEAMALQIAALATEFIIIVAAPMVITWLILRREIARSTLLRGIALALPIQLMIYAAFTLLRHPCLILG